MTTKQYHSIINDYVRKVSLCIDYNVTKYNLEACKNDISVDDRLTLEQKITIAMIVGQMFSHYNLGMRNVILSKLNFRDQ